MECKKALLQRWSDMHLCLIIVCVTSFTFALVWVPFVEDKQNKPSLLLCHAIVAVKKKALSAHLQLSSSIYWYTWISARHQRHRTLILLFEDSAGCRPQSRAPCITYSRISESIKYNASCLQAFAISQIYTDYGCTPQLITEKYTNLVFPALSSYRQPDIVGNAQVHHLN